MAALRPEFVRRIVQSAVDSRGYDMVPSEDEAEIDEADSR